MSESNNDTTMTSNEFNRGKAPDAQDNPDHDVPVEEQLTERQRELVGRDGGRGR